MIKFWPLIVVTALYALQTGILGWRGEWPGAIVFFGYALANVGLIWGLR